MTSIGFSAAATSNGADTKMMSKSVVEGTLPSPAHIPQAPSQLV